MAKRVNYGFEKRQKEAKRKKKQADKLEKKRLSKESKAGSLPLDTGIGATDETPATDAAETPDEEATS